MTTVDLYNKSLVKLPKNLSGFITFANNYPSLSLEETNKLFKLYEETNNLYDVYAVFLSNLKQVVRLSFFYKRKTFNYMISAFDLIQAGCIGLLNAIKCYDYRRNDNFTAYSSTFIRGEIFEYLRNNSAFFKMTTKNEFKVFYNYGFVNSFIKEHNRISLKDYEYISKKLDVTKKDIDTVINKMGCRYNLSPNDIEISENTDNEKLCLLENLPNENLDNPLDILLYQEYDNLIDCIHQNLHKLNERELDVITGRYLTDTKLPFKHYADKYSISIERVRQLEVSAINKLKNSVLK